MKQITDTILMVRPAAFGFNAETAQSNFFQKNIKGNLQEEALRQFDAMVNRLRDQGIEILVVEDTAQPIKPDAVFPNNWICASNHGLHIFPMCAASRRTERRDDIITLLQDKFRVEKVFNWSEYESENHFLEGTGSMVMDHANRVVYACISPRTSGQLLAKFASAQGLECIIFEAFDAGNRRVYHTNVMLCIGEGFAVLCADAIPDEKGKTAVLQKLDDTKHEIIFITPEQMHSFAGNMLHVQNKSGQKFIVMSQTAMNALQNGQIKQLEKYGELLEVDVSAIEAEGGSARCMMAEIFLDRKTS